MEVELFNAKENIVVKSMLTKDANEPKWFINNKAVSKDKLLRLTEKLQIQPGNLCQFLPQDVVREFPQMKPSEIFENTIKVQLKLVKVKLLVNERCFGSDLAFLK